MNKKKIEQSIRYSEYKPELLARFFDYKSMLYSRLFCADFAKYREYVERGITSAAYRAIEAEIFEKVINLDENCDAEKEADIWLLVNKIKFCKPSEEYVKPTFETKVEECGTFDLMIALPRGIRMEVREIPCERGIKVMPTNLFNAYADEGFTVAYRLKRYYISFNLNMQNKGNERLIVSCYCIPDKTLYFMDITGRVDMKSIVIR